MTTSTQRTKSPDFVNRMKTVVNDTPVSHTLRSARERLRFLRWKTGPQVLPPPHLAKVDIIRQSARRSNCKVLIETGTFRGDTAFALRKEFQRIYTIELSDTLYQAARRRLQKYPHIEVIHGDSAQLLAEVLRTLSEPAIFWLDAHYSAGQTARGEVETPVSTELTLIAEHPVREHVLLIDDARCFDGTNDYPRLSDLERTVRALRPDWTFTVATDVIRISSDIRLKSGKYHRDR